MKGIAKVRKQGAAEPILGQMLRERGLDEPPLWKGRPPETRARMKRWKELGKYRNGPVNPEKTKISDVVAATDTIKRIALDLGASVVGCARLTPIMISEGVELSHDYIFCLVIGEDYSVALDGPRAIETESTSIYVQCAEISTKIAGHIRDLGYEALAHHNGGDDIMALPALYAAGFGELGKHGSLIHPELGASFRPGFVTTTMPMFGASRWPVNGSGSSVLACCELQNIPAGSPTRSPQIKSRHAESQRFRRTCSGNRWDSHFVMC